MDDAKKTNKPYIIIDFTKVWRFIPMNRPRKEMIKWILFSTFPMFLKRLAVYQNWITSRIYADKKLNLGSHNFWKRKLCNYYDLDVIEHKNNDLKLPNKKITKIAIIVHVFYLDVFNEILELLLKSDSYNFKLFITAPHHLIRELDDALSSASLQFSLLEVANRGRDVLPFITMLPVVFDEGFELVLKIHTKRSNHLKKKEVWRDDLFFKLLGPGAISNAMQVFEKYQEIGIIGPIGHLLPMSFYYGANAGRVEVLSKKLGLTTDQLANFHFVAGTMFFARKETLLPILNLGLTEHDFEVENNQLDGTLAHALERGFAAGLLASGLKLADTSSNPDKVSCRINTNYTFTL